MNLFLSPHFTHFTDVYPLVSTKEGAATTIYLATDKEYVPRYPGMYWYRMSLRGANRLVEDATARAVIWDQMAVETGLSDALKL